MHQAFNQTVKLGAHATVAGSKCFNKYFTGIYGTAQGQRKENEDVAKIIPSLGFVSYISSPSFRKSDENKNILKHGAREWDFQISRDEKKESKNEFKDENQIIDQDEIDSENKFNKVMGRQNKFSAFTGDNTKICRSDIMYFSVFDGHGGKRCAKFMNWLIPHLLQMYIVEVFDTLKDDDIIARIKRICHLVDELWMEHNPKDESGTTMSIALVCPAIDEKMDKKTKYKGYFAHIGDSRILVLDSTSQIMYQSVDHNAIVESEAIRIKAAGGYSYKDGNTYRTNGLGMSRALGDQNRKQQICRTKSFQYDVSKNKIKNNLKKIIELNDQADFIHVANHQLEKLYKDYHAGRDKYAKDQPISNEPTVTIVEGFSRIIMFTDGMVENNQSNLDIIKQFSTASPSNHYSFATTIAKTIYNDPRKAHDNRTVLLADFNHEIKVESVPEYTDCSKFESLTEENAAKYRLNPSNKEDFVVFGPVSTVQLNGLTKFLSDFQRESRKKNLRHLYCPCLSLIQKLIQKRIQKKPRPIQKIQRNSI